MRSARRLQGMLTEVKACPLDDVPPRKPWAPLGALGRAVRRRRGRVRDLDGRTPPAPPGVPRASVRQAPRRGGRAMPEQIVVDVEGHQLTLTNLEQGAVSRDGLHQGRGDRLLHADRAGAAAAPGRPPLTVKRYPNGVDGHVLLREERLSRGTPDWVRTVTLPVPGSTKNRETIDYIVVERPGHARAAGEPGGAGAARAAVARAAACAQAAHRPDRVRPRPGPAGDDRRVLRGGAAAARHCSRPTG